MSRNDAGRLQRLDRRGEISRPVVGALTYGARSSGTSLIRAVGDLAVDRLALSVLPDDLAAPAAELDTAPLRSCQRILGALADHAPLFLSNHGHDPHR